MRIDAHQHFWDLTRFDYPWMPPEPSKLRFNYLPEDIAPVLKRNKFDGSVAVQATRDPEESAWLLQLSDQHDFILGVVGWVDLTAPSLPQTLDRLQEHPKFRGVRHPAEDEADDRWLLRPAAIEGLREVARRGLTYDLLIRPKHLPLLPELAASVPELALVIDHLAKPSIRDGQFDSWARDFENAASIPHLHCKLSGLVTEADFEHWTSDDLRPYVQHAWTTFGPDRCMFASDWPVCLQAGYWKKVLAGFTQALGPVFKEVREGIMGANAARFYSLTLPPKPSEES